MDIPTLPEFYARLEAHDWFYAFSDDPRVWEAGSHNLGELRTIASRGGTPYQDLLRAYEAHVFSGPHFGTEPAPKPPRP